MAESKALKRARQARYDASPKGKECRRRYMARKRVQAKAEGMCVVCLKNPSQPNRQACAECAAYNQEWNWLRRR